MKSNRCVVIMAGGSGTRMGSNIPKQLCGLADKPMMMHLIDKASQICSEIILILSTANRKIILDTLEEKYIRRISDDLYEYNQTSILISEQPIANGTGGAVIAAKDQLQKQSNGTVLILSADVPLIRKETMLNMFDQCDRQTNCVILAKNTTDNAGYGRIIMNNNNFIKIVEDRDCTDGERAITLINTGIYVFKIGSLLKALEQIDNNNSQQEYYLTDCPMLINNECVKVMEINNDLFDETAGANTPDQLEYIRKEYQKIEISTHI